MRQTSLQLREKRVAADIMQAKDIGEQDGKNFIFELLTTKWVLLEQMFRLTLKSIKAVDIMEVGAL